MKIKKRFAPAALAMLSFFVAAAPAAAQISLGSAQSFGVLAGSAVTSTGATTVNGNVGVSPGSAVTGFPPGVIVGGTIHGNDALAIQAQSDLATAYDEIAGTACSVDLTGQDLGGLTLTPGVYCFSASAQLTGALVLDALGDPDALFLFQIGSTLTSASGSSVAVINGGSGCGQVFWQVGSSATLGTATAFAGDILALTSITLTTGADSSGRTLARNGAVTLDSSDVNTCGVPGCPAIDLDPRTLPPGRVLEPYAEAVTASGGSPPYTYSISEGALPPGYLLDPATGLISGVATETGEFGFTVQATDSAGCIGSRLYSLTILEEIFGVVEVPALGGPALGMLALLLALAAVTFLRRP